MTYFKYGNVIYIIVCLTAQKHKSTTMNTPIKHQFFTKFRRDLNPKSKSLMLIYAVNIISLAQPMAKASNKPKHKTM